MEEQQARKQLSNDSIALVDGLKRQHVEELQAERERHEILGQQCASVCLEKETLAAELATAQQERQADAESRTVMGAQVEELRSELSHAKSTLSEISESNLQKTLALGGQIEALKDQNQKLASELRAAGIERDALAQLRTEHEEQLQ